MVRKYQGPLQPGKRSAKVYGLNKTEKQQTRTIVQRAIRQNNESKVYYHNRTTDYEITTASPFLTDFLNIPKGLTDNLREGDEIIFQQLKINLFLTGSVDGAVKSGRALDHVRVILFRWNQSDFVNGSPNNPSALKLFGSNLPVGSNLYTAMIDHKENGRSFTILTDKRVKLSGEIAGAENEPDSPEHKTKFVSLNLSQKKYGCKKVKYDSLNPNDNSHMKGVFLMVLTDNTGGALISGPTLSIDSRFIFKDP